MKRLWCAGRLSQHAIEKCCALGKRDCSDESMASVPRPATIAFIPPIFSLALLPDRTHESGIFRSSSQWTGARESFARQKREKKGRKSNQAVLHHHLVCLDGPTGKVLYDLFPARARQENKWQHFSLSLFFLLLLVFLFFPINAWPWWWWGSGAGRM